MQVAQGYGVNVNGKGVSAGGSRLEEGIVCGKHNRMKHVVSS